MLTSLYVYKENKAKEFHLNCLRKLNEIKLLQVYFFWGGVNSARFKKTPVAVFCSLLISSFCAPQALAGDFSTVNGGQGNTATGDYSTINGGQEGTASGKYSTINGGSDTTGTFESPGTGTYSEKNFAQGDYSTINGGAGVRASAVHSTINGGRYTAIEANADYGTINGSFISRVNGKYGTINGGYIVQTDGEYATVNGGKYNAASGKFSTINGGGGAWSDTSVTYAVASADFATINGGQAGQARANYATINGGSNNHIWNLSTSSSEQPEFGTINGGSSNTVLDPYGTINGGASNLIVGKYATIDGGSSNNASGDYSVIVGGSSHTASSQFATIIGGNANSIYADYATAIGGSGNQVRSEYSTIVGGNNNATSGKYSAINGGYLNKASGDYSAVNGGFGNTGSGEYSTLDGGYQNTASGNYSTVVGGQNGTAAGAYSVVVGGNGASTSEAASNSVAIGSSASVTARDAVAIGTGSAADTTRTVSFGSSDTQAEAAAKNNRIVRIANGVNAQDAAAMNQIVESVSSSDGTVSVTENVNSTSGAKSYDLKVNIPGATVSDTVAENDSNAVSGGAVYKEVRPASDGAYVKSAQTTGENLAALDTHVKANADKAAQNAADIGTVNATIAGLGNTYSKTDLSNVTDAGKAAVRGLAKESVKVVAGTNTTVTEGAEGDAKTYAVNVSSDSIKGAVQGDLDAKANLAADNLSEADIQAWQGKLGNGSVASGNTGLVTGGSVYTEVRPEADGNYVKSAKTAGENLALLDTHVKANADKAAQNATDIGTINSTISGLGNTYSKTDLSNVTDAGKAAVRGLAKESVKVVAGTNTTVTEGAEGDAKTYAVNVSNDSIKGAVKADLDAKANLAADNLSEAHVQAWQGKLGNGSVASGNIGLVTGGSVYTEVRPEADGNYVKSAKTAGENLALLDTHVKANADKAAQNATDIGTINSTISGLGNTYSKTDLSNVTDAGKAAVRGLAKESVKVVAGTNTTVTEGAEGDAKTYAVNVSSDSIKGAVQGDLDAKANLAADNLSEADIQAWQNKLGNGAVASGNAGLVTGGILYREVRPTAAGNYIQPNNSVAQNLSVLDAQIGKRASSDLDNISAAGKENITKLINISSSDGSVTVNETTNNQGVKSFNLAVKTNSPGADISDQVSKNSQALVTSGGIYDEVRPSQAGAYVKPEQTTGQNITALDKAASSIVNADTSVINTANWQRALGTGTVDSNSSGLVTGKTVYAETRSADGTIVSSGNTAGQNINLLDSAISSINATVGNLDQNYAKTDLGNVSESGKGVIRNLAKESIKVLAGQNTTVTKGSEGTADTYTVNVSDNAIKSVMKEDMDKKADRNASNLSADDVASWQEKLGTGSVENGNTGLVSGGTVYTAIQNVNKMSSLVQTDGDTITIDAGGTASTIDITGGMGQTRVLTGVATNPSDPTSAANVGFVDYQIQRLNNHMSRRINQAGADAAALAALHPVDFDPDHRFMLAAGVGHYKDRTAASIGAFWYPTDSGNLLLSAGYANSGSDSNMINAGLTYRFGGNFRHAVDYRQLAQQAVSRSNDLEGRLSASITRENSLAEKVDELIKSRDKAEARASTLESELGKMKEKFNALAAKVESLLH
ncbi:hypothetical protein MUN46_011095 [Mesosutterella sp. AGMB02718]|uniref:Uncharacterized protein n=1 Tax=Mesosutterella faecium TaxID=2925194 RepID=A0ABT7IT74_9BURK|nr:hypothetical protein [Mesosutterella sp. AGMB02718]MDL2060482.1 hypothetical protein [Mesosutterella sp. AGMB02718]